MEGASWASARWVLVALESPPFLYAFYFQRPSLHSQFCSWRKSLSKIHFAFAKFPS